jgi:hypothetical protein
MHYFISSNCCIKFRPRFALDFESVTLQNVIRRMKWACEEFPHPYSAQAPEECSKINGVCCIYTCALLISSKHRPEERNKCGKNSSVIDSAALVTALLDERERCTSNCAGCPVAWLYNCSHIVGAPPERIRLQSALVQTLGS